MAILCDRLPLNASVSSAYSAVCTAPSGYQGRFGWSVSLTYENRYGGSSSKLSLSTCCAIIDGMSRHNISMNCPCCLASMGRFPAGRRWTRSSPGSGSDTGSKRRSEKDAGPPVLSRWIVTSPGEGARKRNSCPDDEPNVPEGVSVSMRVRPLVRALKRQSDPASSKRFAKSPRCQARLPQSKACGSRLAPPARPRDPGADEPSSPSSFRRSCRCGAAAQWPAARQPAESNQSLQELRD